VGVGVNDKRSRARLFRPTCDSVSGEAWFPSMSAAAARLTDGSHGTDWTDSPVRVSYGTGAFHPLD